MTDVACPQYKPAPGVLTQRTDDGIILLSLNTNSFYSLNRTATRFWELLNGGQQITAIEEQLLAEFDIDPAALRAEIDTLLHDLTSKSLVCHADR